MTPPIRPALFALTAYDDKKPWTMREIAEWWKTCVKGAEPLGQLTALETKHLNERWVYLVKLKAEQEGVPTGLLSYFIGELAQTEMQLAETAALEAEAALSYGQ
jgi:hypothetical protein